jgi:hypothetical protein
MLQHDQGLGSSSNTVLVFSLVAKCPNGRVVLQVGQHEQGSGSSNITVLMFSSITVFVFSNLQQCEVVSSKVKNPPKRSASVASLQMTSVRQRIPCVYSSATEQSQQLTSACHMLAGITGLL